MRLYGMKYKWQSQCIKMSGRSKRFPIGSDSNVAWPLITFMLGILLPAEKLDLSAVLRQHSRGKISIAPSFPQQPHLRLLTSSFTFITSLSH